MKNQAKIKLIFGLGNPDPEFVQTRHNFGRDLIEKYLKEPKKRDNFVYSKFGRLNLAIGLTYMNESGKAVKAAIDFFKVKPEETLIISDEADLPFLYLKFSFGRDPAGHKGVESIIKATRTKSFWRLRIGIQPKIRQKAEVMILKKLNKKENEAWLLAKKRFKIILERFETRRVEQLNISQKFFLIGE